MKSKLVKGAVRLTLAATLVFGGTLVVNAETSQADSMGCYGWFDYVYKSTGDLNFAYWHYQQCQTWKSAQLVQKSELSPIDISIPEDGLKPIRPIGSPGSAPLPPLQPVQPVQRFEPFHIRP